MHQNTNWTEAPENSGGGRMEEKGRGGIRKEGEGKGKQEYFPWAKQFQISEQTLSGIYEYYSPGEICQCKLSTPSFIIFPQYHGTTDRKTSRR